MKIVDLTREFISESSPVHNNLKQIPLHSGKVKYTGMVWLYDFDSMAGSYIDFPGHILECDDGVRGDNVDPAQYFRMPATVIHLNRESGSGAVSAEELRAANGGDKTLPFLIINALGEKDPHDISWLSVYFDDSAVQWIINTGCKLLISDIFESTEIEGVFFKLFKQGISTVCEPVNLWKLTGTPLITIMFPRIPAAQIPVRMIAEVPEQAE